MPKSPHHMKVLKHIKEAKGRTIGIPDLAEDLNCTSEELMHVVEMLQRRDQVRVAAGLSQRGRVCRMIYIPGEPEEEDEDI